MLTVYRASAGAGKTHTLTGEYLLLLFSAPENFRHILAVTFTNKATDEMKNRIVNELYHLASGKPSDYIQTLQSVYPLNETQIRTQARKVLIDILHDYSAFHISTIDRFFQQTMRAFTREIGLHGGYGIEMDQELVLTTAIDNLLSDLDRPENKELLGWLLRFAEERIENGSEWNLRREIMALGYEVFKESYKMSGGEIGQSVADRQSLDRYKSELYKIIRSVEFEAKSLGEEALYIMDQHMVKPSDFKGGSRSPLTLFERLAKGEMKEPTATFTGLVDNIDNYYNKSTSIGMREILKATVLDGLNDCVRGTVYLFSHLTDYYTAREIARYYYTLGILADISRQIAGYREEKNVMLIADTTELLSKIIGESDAPFIYEKIGTRINHYMIDEFQDTSKMQWNNFRPLLEESLAQGYDNLIVGDVKQSIYRFRNSDWKLLDEQIHEDFLPEEFREKTLQDNWRSCPEIIAFNNAFFKAMPTVLQGVYNETLSQSSLNEREQAAFSAKIISAYDKSHQRIPPRDPLMKGHVRIEFLSDSEEEGEEKKEWREKALGRLPRFIEQLQDNGYALKDIAILVRTNQEGAQVADALLEYREKCPSGTYRYELISDDALFVGSSASVRFLITVLRSLMAPADKISRETARYLYQIIKGCFGNDPADCPAGFLQQSLSRLRELAGQSLYEIVEGLFRLFADDFPDSEQVFIQAFLDMVSEFTQKEHADLGLFLQWWDESGYKKTVATPDGQDAIRILTIHKSKGLGFKAVIIPFCDWSIDHKPSQQTILWCHPQKPPFNRLQSVPVCYTPQLGKTIFAKEYFNEKLHTFIDNLNTLYVAFTRAEETLYVFAPYPKKIDRQTDGIEKISTLADAVWASLHTDASDEPEGGPFIRLSDFCRTDVFEIGNITPPQRKKEQEGPEEIEMARMASVSPADRLRLRLRGKSFFLGDSRRKYGTLMHEVLSGVRTSQDILPAVERYRREGVIDEGEAGRLRTRLTELLARPQVASWYDGTAEIWNETDILSGEGLSKRPDRVMIWEERAVVVDYKFGGHPEAVYRQQMSGYLKLIRQMGFRQVEGFLWYVELDRIESVQIG